MITKESLREEYENETGKKHGNLLFSTTDYACWLEKKIVKNCFIPDVVERSEQLLAFCEWLSERDFTCPMTSPENWVKMYLKSK